METLKSSCDCCERVSAAEKLGCRLHADYCACPAILDALIEALLCDTCPPVRRAAAWSIALQGARVPKAVMALYIASKADRHFLVRDRANDALGILIVCRTKCYDDLFKAADVVIARIRPDYDPTNGKCVRLVALLGSEAGEGAAAPLPEAVGTAKPEPLAMPKEEPKE